MRASRVAGCLLAATLALAWVGCAQPSDRNGRLLTMAGEEAAGISNKLDRFTRQLNIADTQLRTNRTADAAKTLALARETLIAAGKAGSSELDDFHRIAGWTSISQLARRANDRDLALQSADNAMAALNDVQPEVERPQYVLSLAGELADLRGQEAAIELVNSGGDWASKIVEATARRTALVAFTDRLLSYEAYEGARTMLRRDPDAVWRTDTFLALANTRAGVYNQAYVQASSGMVGGRGGGGMGGAAMERQMDRAMPAAPTFGKDVRFESVFQQGGR